MGEETKVLEALLKELAKKEGEPTDKGAIEAMLKGLEDSVKTMEVAKMVPGYDGEPDIDVVEVCTECEEETCVCPVEPTVGEMINDGMVHLFEGFDGPLNAELAWLNDPKHVKEDPKIAGRLEQKAVKRVGYLTLEGIDDMMFFLDLCTSEDGAWYWYRAKDALIAAASERLVSLTEEQKAEDEDQAMMDAAMAAKEVSSG